MKKKLVVAHTFKEGDYVPSKEDVINLIKKDVVTVAIIKQERFNNEEEKLTIVITHP